MNTNLDANALFAQFQAFVAAQGLHMPSVTGDVGSLGPSSGPAPQADRPQPPPPTGPITPYRSTQLAPMAGSGPSTFSHGHPAIPATAHPPSRSQPFLGLESLRNLHASAHTNQARRASAACTLPSAPVLPAVHGRGRGRSRSSRPPAAISVPSVAQCMVPSSVEREINIRVEMYVPLVSWPGAIVCD